MTSPTQPQTTSQQTEEELNLLLQRLSQKNSVQSVLILDRKNGAIIRASGSMARPTSLGPTAGTGDTDVAVEYAALVYKYVKSAEELVGEIVRVDEASGVTAGSGDMEKETREEEDLKLLRLRTKKRELVIVPDPKFILVVFHDTPPA